MTAGKKMKAWGVCLWQWVRRRLNLRTLVLLALVAGVYVLIGCPFKYFTGISCPGCGMSRALFSLLRFDVHTAVHYHPLVFLLFPAGALFLVRSQNVGFLRARRVVLFTFAAVLVAVYLYRMFLGDGTVVSVEQPGIIKDIYKFILFWRKQA